LKQTNDHFLQTPIQTLTFPAITLAIQFVKVMTNFFAIHHTQGSQPNTRITGFMGRVFLMLKYRRMNWKET